MTKPIVNIDDVELFGPPPSLAPAGPARERYEARIGFIGTRIGAHQLGYNVTAISPGKRAFPFHNHRVNEEMFFVLAGRGEIRIGLDRHPVRAGDFIACLAGGPETAHQIVNTGDEELRFLAVSTMRSPEVAEYPDTGRFGLLAHLDGADGQTRPLRFVGREEDSLDYWEGA